MPKEGQKSVTLSESTLKLVESIADKEDRSVASIIRLCIEATFGTKQEQKKAKVILGQLQERYN